jgi:ABC-type transporter Mla MlaB component
MSHKQSKIGNLILEGAATVRTAEATHAKLADFLRHHSDIEIDCTGITEADLSLVQLLVAARKSAKRSGKTVVLTAPAGGALREALSQGGFLPALEGQASSDEAFWLKGRDAR